MVHPQFSRQVRVAWLFIVVIGGLLLIYGVLLFFTGPDMVLTNISERTTLGPDDFRIGSPSALDVMSVVVRQAASFTAAVGLMVLIAGWRGYQAGSKWAWWASWGAPIAIAGTGIGFIIAGGTPQAVGFLVIAALVAVALVVAGRSLFPRAT